MPHSTLRTQITFAIITSLLSISLAALVPSNLSLACAAGITSLAIVYIAIMILKDPEE